MKKFISMITAAVTVMVCMCITAFAETEDVEMSTVRAKMSPAWGQSISYTSAEISVSSFTEDTEILVEYETEEGAMPENGYHPVELIFQRYDVEPPIWCQISPVEFNETSARFVYADIVAFYADMGGKADLSDVNTVCLGATMVGAKITKVTVTNCTVKAALETTAAETTAAETTVAETEAAPAETTAAETTAAETTAAPKAEKEEASEGGLNMTLVIIIIVAVIVVAGVVVTIIVIKKNRSRFY